MVPVTLIGVSGYAASHYASLMEAAHRGILQLVGATVINPDQERHKCISLGRIGCTVFPDYGEMLHACRGKARLCFIPTGISLHCPMTVDALHAGMNVLVEKPAAATVQEVIAMRRAAAETGRFVAVAYQDMYSPTTHELKRLLCDGTLGRILKIKGRGLLNRPAVYFKRNDWAGRISMNGRWVLDSPFNNAMAHHLNLMCFFGGPVFEQSLIPVAVTAELYRAHDIESADTACMRIETDRNIELLFYTTVCSRERLSPEIQIITEKAGVCWRDSDVIISWNDGRRRELGRKRIRRRGPGSSQRRYVYDAVLNRVRGGDAFICTLDIAGAQTVCANGAHESSAVVRVPEQAVETIPPGDRTVIRDIEEPFFSAFTGEKLLSEIGIPWARPGTRVSLEGYSRFPSMNQSAGRACSRNKS